jgi:hypothetical protein
MTTVSKAIATKPSSAPKGGLNPYRADIEDIVIKLANKELETKTNSGKTEFTAIVVKVLAPANVEESERQLLTDLFLNEEYAIDREDNLTYFSNSNKNVAFLHIPALYSYTTFYTEADSKKSDITTSDLFLYPVVTALSLSPQQQVKVTFGDLENFKGLRIIPPPATEKKKNVKKSARGTINNLVVLMKAREACTKLQNTPPSGSKISSKSLVNPSNPLVGYSGFYGDYIKNILTSETLRRRTILTLGTTDAKTKLFKPDTQIVPLTSDNVENALIAESSYATFGVKIYVGDNKIKEFIEANDTSTTFKNAESFPIEIADPEIKGSFDFSSIGKKQEIDKKNRAIYLKVVPLNPEGQKPDSKLKSLNEINDLIIDNVKDYIAGVTRNKYNYSFDSSQNIFAIDIFGKTSDEQLIEGDVDLAIDYSKAKKSTEQPQPGVLQPIVSFFQQQPKKNPSPAPAGKESTATPNQELNACGASNKLVNENAYFSLEDDKTVSQTSYSKDNVLYAKFYQSALELKTTDIAEAAIRSQEPSEADLKKFNSKVFSYEAKEEIISVIQEGKEVKSQKKNKKLSTGSNNKASTTGALNIGRGTNLQQIQKNTQNLINFAKGFRKFVAQNEGVSETSVVLLPLSTFRKFVDVKKPGEGIDQNSRHFFNRAIDFVVYINNDPNFVGFSADGSPTIPKKDTFEIPNYIVYVYLLKFIKQNGAKFGQSGIGLLEKSQKRKTGYIHYEMMSDYREPEKGVQRAKRERRWVSQPQDNNKESVYKQAFDKNGKDAIITQFVIKKLETQVGANLPEKFTRILK